MEPTIDELAEELKDFTPLQFKMTIELGNAGMLKGSDLASALRTVAARLDRDSKLVYGLGGLIGDANGNKVGQYDVEYLK